MDGLRLENILKYVRIPDLKIASTTASKEGARDGVGRKDYQQIFDLLWNKGVKKIIKIRVEENEDTPHRDEVLESLERFYIEEWDWKRSDLCSEVLLKAAMNVKKATLYSSGNTAVLRSWSGAEGLNLLTKARLTLPLELLILTLYSWKKSPSSSDRFVSLPIYLTGFIDIYGQRFQSEAKVNEYKNAFISRMELNCKRIKVKVTVESHTVGRKSTEQVPYGGGEKDS